MLDTIDETNSPKVAAQNPLSGACPPAMKRTQVPAAPSAVSSKIVTGPAGLTQMMNNLSVGQRQTFSNGIPSGSWDPSQAPAPPIPASNYTSFPQGGLRTQATRYPIEYGNSNKNKWYQNQVCIKSPFRRADFRKGQVIAVPFHTSNMNENADPNDNALTDSAFGPVLSKRRMFIIMHIHLEGMFCLPLYSFGKRGIVAKRGDREVEYMPVMDNYLKGKYVNQSKVYMRPLVHKHDNPNNNLSEDTVCHLTGGVRVGWQEQILTVGRLTEISFVELCKNYAKLCQTAEQMPWDF